MGIGTFKIIVALAVVQPSGVACDEATQQARISGTGRVVRTCIQAQARRLYRSRDQAYDVATAIMVTCQPRLDAILEAARICHPGSNRALRSRLERDFHRIAVSEIIELRASRRP